jgi:dihydrofolate reductase
MWVISGSFKNDVWNSTDGVTWTTATDSAAFSDRTHHTAVVFKDKMWVIGGYTGSSRYANDVWNSTDGVTWTPVTNSAQFPARSNHTTVVFKDQIWVIGGADRSKILDRVEEPYSPKNDVWRSTNGITWTTATDSAQFPARGDHTSVVFDNKIWVIGGDIRDDSDSDSYYGIRANDVWSSTDGITWTKMDNPGFAVRDSHSSVVFNNRVWVIGGFFEDDVWYMVKE